jgi:hypothetical protein
MTLSTEKTSEMRFENSGVEKEDLAGTLDHGHLTRKVLWKLDSRFVTTRMLDRVYIY